MTILYTAIQTALQAADGGKEVRAIADRLIASCDGGNDEIENIMALSLEQCEALDRMALECESCGQWFDAKEVSDVDGKYLCGDCAP